MRAREAGKERRAAVEERERDGLVPGHPLNLRVRLRGVGDGGTRDAGFDAEGGGGAVGLELEGRGEAESAGPPGQALLLRQQPVAFRVEARDPILKEVGVGVGDRADTAEVCGVP